VANTTNELLEKNAGSASKIKVKLLQLEKNEAAGYVLIEGNSEALKFLANLILAQAEAMCGLQIHPNGPGSMHFTTDSDLGLYLHTIPCDPAI
jgi:hypothetical protein